MDDLVIHRHVTGKDNSQNLRGRKLQESLTNAQKPWNFVSKFRQDGIKEVALAGIQLNLVERKPVDQMADKI